MTTSKEAIAAAREIKNCVGIQDLYPSAPVSLESNIASIIQKHYAAKDAALEKINAIRNSIIAFQSCNFSEHIYPLVAALNEVGIKGMPYPEALAYFGPILERANKAEAERDQLKARVAELEKSILAIEAAVPVNLIANIQELERKAKALDWLQNGYHSVEFWITLQGETNLLSAIESAMEKQK